MEASMHGTFERSRETGDKNVSRNSGVGFLAVPVFVAVTLVAMAITQPAVSNWIADAAQAEFSGIAMTPDAATAQIAQPAAEVRTVKAN
jgi:hypothetical protein